MIKTSSTGYVILNTLTHFKEPCIPTGKKDGDRIEVLCFMSPLDRRTVFIGREDILEN